MSRPIVGTVKGNLTILSVKDCRRGWLCLCLCTCGQIVELRASYVVGYKSRFSSCNINGHRFLNTTRHGWSRQGKLRTPEHCIWVGMRQRCQNPNDEGYGNYGGRGIRVCERWEVFENFIADMGKRPAGMTLHRKDNDGDYKPSNCVWESRKTQANNRRSNHFLNHAGQRKTIAEWCASVGLSRSTIWCRLNRGWTVFKTLTTPQRKNQYV